MSASEKLKALPVPFDTSEMHSTAIVLCDAVPQIIAVVEAQGKVADWLESVAHGWAQDRGLYASPAVQEQIDKSVETFRMAATDLRKPLAALDEALP